MNQPNFNLSMAYFTELPAKLLCLLHGQTQRLSFFGAGSVALCNKHSGQTGDSAQWNWAYPFNRFSFTKLSVCLCVCARVCACACAHAHTGSTATWGSHLCPRVGANSGCLGWSLAWHMVPAVEKFVPWYLLQADDLCKDSMLSLGFVDKTMPWSL